MNIVVCLKEVIDTGINLGYGQVNPALMQKGQGYKLNPNDSQALAEALNLKKANPGVQIILISLGSEKVEPYLRDGLALGADKAIRIWDENFIEITPYQTARVLSRAIKLLSADLILVGAKSLDNASGLTGPSIAAWLDIPCICEVARLKIDKDFRSTTIIRRISEGMQEKVLSSLPAVIAVYGSEGKLPYASLDQILNSLEAPITNLSLPEIGFSPLESQKDPTHITGISFPRPRPKNVTYDSSLPAFQRILALLQGGITKRRGEILKGDIESLVNQLFDLLLKEEVIKQASK